jgi:hypothetical protein
MSNYYLKVIAPSSETKRTKSSFTRRVSAKILETIFPVANPNFENQIEKVNAWLLEFEKEDNCPVREIGLDILGKPIMIMPWKENYGYWTDNNLSFEDFKKHFRTENSNSEEFEIYWKRFENDFK